MWVYCISINLPCRNGYVLGFVPKSIRTHLSTTRATVTIMTDMIQAPRDLTREIRIPSISDFYRPYHNIEKRGDFAETSAGRTIQFHVDQAILDAISGFRRLASNALSTSSR
jgi:hypothetical protein